MPASIGVNLRVTGHCRQGGRKYMEDFFSVAYQQTEDERDLEYAFFGIYDGHGGSEAAAFAKERLMETIVRHKYFWSDNDEDVLRSIKLGYIATHYAMWKEQDKWPKTTSGLPSTAGTTASIAFIRRGKIYIGHVGDSAIVLGYQEPGCSEWKAKPLTRDHKPESAVEMTRIEQCGGKVVSKLGVPRVVWNRPRIGHKGPVRRSTPIDEIPFLSIARSLGDLWSYNSELDEFVVSPDPDCSVISIDTSTFRCLIFGTDGLYNMLSAQMAVHIVQQAEKHNEDAALSDAPNKIWLNPSKCLVEKALKLWSTTKMRADNTSVVTLMLDPPGPPRAQVLRNRKKAYPDSGLKILTRYQNEPTGQSNENPIECTTAKPRIPDHNPQILQSTTSYRSPTPPDSKSIDLQLADVNFSPDHSKCSVLKPRESLSFDPNNSVTPETPSKVDAKSIKNIDKVHNLRNSETKTPETSQNPNESKIERCVNCKKSNTDISDISTSSSSISSNPSTALNLSEENIQINEISSSSNEFEDKTVEDENFSKTNFRKRRVRSPRKSIKKPDKLETKVTQNRKRCLTESNDLDPIKKQKNSENDVIKHNLRIRKISSSENVLKKNDEMVNQVDSTNKELRKRLSPRKHQNCKEEIPILNDINSNIENTENGLNKKLIISKEIVGNVKTNSFLRKSQRLKQAEMKLKPKQKIKERLKNKFNQKKIYKNLSRRIILKNANKDADKKPNKENINNTVTSSMSKDKNKGLRSKGEKSKSKERKVTVSSKIKSDKGTQTRTFKVGYLKKLRRHISARNRK